MWQHSSRTNSLATLKNWNVNSSIYKSFISLYISLLKLKKYLYIVCYFLLIKLNNYSFEMFILIFFYFFTCLNGKYFFKLSWFYFKWKKFFRYVQLKTSVYVYMIMRNNFILFLLHFFRIWIFWFKIIKKYFCIYFYWINRYWKHSCLKTFLLNETKVDLVILGLNLT